MWLYIILFFLGYEDKTRLKLANDIATSVAVG